MALPVAWAGSARDRRERVRLRIETFTCPECGEEVLPTAAPGLRVPCPSCATQVEIPFLPRTLGKRRPGHRRPVWVGVTASGVTLIVLLATILAIAIVRGRVVGHRQNELARLIGEARASEAKGDLGTAIVEADAARAFSRNRGVTLPEGFSSWRDDLAGREAESRLRLARGLISSEPGRARGLLLTLREVSKSDPAVSAMAGRIAGALDDAREAEARALLASGGEELNAGHPAQAMERVAQARKLAAELGSTRAAAVQSDAESLALRVSQTRGVRVEPPSGDFTLGNPDAYREALLVPASRELNRHGYLVLEGPMAAQAAYTLAMTVTETPMRYLKTPHRACRLVAQLSLSRGSEPRWSTSVDGQTRMPLPGLTAAESGRMSAASAPLREAEDRFFRDALTHAAAALPSRLRTLPAPH